MDLVTTFGGLAPHERDVVRDSGVGAAEVAVR